MIRSDINHAQSPYSSYVENYKKEDNSRSKCVGDIKAGVKIGQWGCQSRALGVILYLRNF